MVKDSDINNVKLVFIVILWYVNVIYFFLGMKNWEIVLM